MQREPGRATDVFDQMAEQLERPGWQWPAAILIAIFYLASSLYISAHRLLWYDEIVTAIMSRTLDVGSLWRMLKVGAEQVPILYFLITRASDQLFGHADYALRVPSALAVTAAMLVVFDIARRLSSGLHGLIAVALITTSFVPNYAFEARPYGLCFLVAAGLLWVWTVTPTSSSGGALAFGALIFLGILIHPYVIFCTAPFGIAALRQRRPFQPKILTMAAGVVAALIVLTQQIASSHALTGTVLNTWAPPTTRALYGIYLDFFPQVTLPLVLAAVGVAVFAQPQNRIVGAMSEGERTAWLFLAIPLAGFIGALAVTHFFFHRYFIATVAGAVVAAACMVCRYRGVSLRPSLALLILLLGSGGYQQIKRVRHVSRIQPNSALDPSESSVFGDHQERSRILNSWEDAFQREGKTKIAVCVPVLFVEAWYYSPHPGAFQLLQYAPPWVLAKFIPISFPTVEDIVKSARQTAIVEPPPRLILELEAAGLRTRLRFAYPIRVVYLE